MIGTFAALVAFEAYARYALSHQPLWLDRFQFRATRPAPYVDARYFSQAFLQESVRSVRLTRRPGRNELILGDVQGKWFNVSDGKRVTTDQPSTFANRIYLFGGSTVFDQEVPDELTVASYLQRRVNETMPG